MIEKKERNLEMYNKKINGVSWKNLMIEYGMSYSSIYRIIKRYGSRNTT